MAWEGDPPGACGPIASPTFGASMPTAICRIFTREGFLIAADGRKVIDVMGKGREIKEDTQKIFPLETPGGELAYSLGGTVGLGLDDSDEVIFRFADGITAAAKELEDARAGDLYEYARMLATSLYRSLLAVHQSGRIAPFGTEPETNRPGCTIAWVFLDGYFTGRPSRVRVRFFHESQILLPPDVEPQDLLMGNPEGYGSDKIFQEVFWTDNPHFAAYRKPKLLSDQVTLDYAREMAEGYIRAFADPEAKRLDPWACEYVGPRIHTATVTRSAGFRLGHWTTG